MVTVNSKSRLLEFRLSPEASKRIEKRISRGELSILRNIPIVESKLVRVGRIANAAMEILERRNQPIEGCSSEKAVMNWLNRKRSKEASVFKALCEAVDEKWTEVFDRSIYSEILLGEEKRAFESFMNSFFGVFVSSYDEKALVLSKYSQFMEQSLGSEKIDSDTVTELIDTFIREFAFNGRQIRFKVISKSANCSITSVKIKGKNQRDVVEIWEIDYSDPFPEISETENWWWKGNISIQFEIVIGTSKFNKSCEVHIPEKGYVWAEAVFDLENEVCSII